AGPGVGRLRFRQEVPPLLLAPVAGVAAQRVEAGHLEAGRPVADIGQVLRQGAVVAEEQGPEPFRRETLGLVHRQQRLPGARAAADRGPAPAAEHAEDLPLLRRQADADLFLLRQWAATSLRAVAGRAKTSSTRATTAFPGFLSDASLLRQ